jgi:hypothetical protein
MKEMESKPAFDPKLYFKPNTIATTCRGRGVRRGEVKEGMERKRDDRLEEEDFGAILRTLGPLDFLHPACTACSLPCQRAEALFQRQPTNAGWGNEPARRSTASPSHQPSANSQTLLLSGFPRVVWLAL